MYQVTLTNTPENRQAVEELGITFYGDYIESALYIYVQIYTRGAGYTNYDSINSPHITVEHLAPILLINDVIQSLHYMLGAGLLSEEEVANMVILEKHRVARGI